MKATKRQTVHGMYTTAEQARKVFGQITVQTATDHRFYDFEIVFEGGFWFIMRSLKESE